MQITGKSCESGEWVSVRLNGSRIEAVEPLPALPAGQAEVWIAPAFIDIQVNGYKGYNFNFGSWTKGDTTDEGFARLAGLLAAAGTAQSLPTIVTNHAEGLLGSMKAIARAVDADNELAAALPAIHLEGPYISSEDGARGAHPLDCVRDPDWNEFQRFQEAANGLIKIITLAPERDGAFPFIEKAAAAGVVVSIGHTAANSGPIRDAVRAGASMSTHLGNGSHAVIPRHPNYVWDQLAEDGLTACFITDGFHVDPAALKAMMRAKGRDRSIIVSDAVALGGQPPGLYDDGRHEVLPSGKVVLAGTPYLAGAGFLLDTCLAYALRHTGLDMKGLVSATSTNPARLLGLANKGHLAPGYDADITLFTVPECEAPLNILATCRGGKLVYGEG